MSFMGVGLIFKLSSGYAYRLTSHLRPKPGWALDLYVANMLGVGHFGGE